MIYLPRLTAEEFYRMLGVKYIHEHGMFTLAERGLLPPFDPKSKPDEMERFVQYLAER